MKLQTNVLYRVHVLHGLGGRPVRMFCYQQDYLPTNLEFLGCYKAFFSSSEASLAFVMILFSSKLAERHAECFTFDSIHLELHRGKNNSVICECFQAVQSGNILILFD